MAFNGLFEFFENGKNLTPRRKSNNRKLLMLHKQAQASLNSDINLRQVVKLPNNEDMNDWLAVNVVNFYNRIDLIYYTISDFCCETSCPTMSGGKRYEYLWADGKKYKKPAKMSAPMYIEFLMNWIETQVDNEKMFPVANDVPFPKSFNSRCRKILSRLFRVFVHVYFHHFDRLVAIGAETHFHFCFKHFYYFVQEFDLMNAKELEPLAELASHICRDL